MENVDRNELVKKHEGLICKVTNQFARKINMPFEDIKSMAYEGFIYAMDTYDSGKSNLTFTQYAGWSIRNAVLNSISNECRTVKMSTYFAKKAQERGDTTFTSVELNERVATAGGTVDVYEMNSPFVYSDKFSDGDVLETLYQHLEDHFSQMNCDIFYRRFGLKGYSEHNGKELAEMYNISCSSISGKVKAIITYIQKNSELCELLASLMNN